MQQVTIVLLSGAIVIDLIPFSLLFQIGFV
jgi:hypothetical protein